MEWTLNSVRTHMKGNRVRDMFFRDHEHGYSYHAHINRKGNLSCFKTNHVYCKRIDENEFIHAVNSYCYGERMKEEDFFEQFDNIDGGRMKYMDFVVALGGI